MISLHPLQEPHLQQLEHLKVSDEQLKYVGTMEEILVNVSDIVHPHVVVVENQVVGIFLIDTQYHLQHDFCGDKALGFRAFFIDEKHQGKGYASSVMKALREYINQHYLDSEYLYLTVNCKNPIAYRCYANAHFVDTGELYHGGAAGPQHIMLMNL